MKSSVPQLLKLYKLTSALSCGYTNYSPDPVAQHNAMNCNRLRIFNYTELSGKQKVRPLEMEKIGKAETCVGTPATKHGFLLSHRMFPEQPCGYLINKGIVKYGSIPNHLPE